MLFGKMMELILTKGPFQTHTHMHTHVRAHTTQTLGVLYAQIQTHTHTYMCMHTHKCLVFYRHKYKQTHTHACVCAHTQTVSAMCPNTIWSFPTAPNFFVQRRIQSSLWETHCRALSTILLMSPRAPSTRRARSSHRKAHDGKLGQPYELAYFSTQGNNSRQQVGRFCLVLRAALLGVRLTGLSQREATPWHSAGAAGCQAPSVLRVR